MSESNYRPSQRAEMQCDIVNYLSPSHMCVDTLRHMFKRHNVDLSTKVRKCFDDETENDVDSIEDILSYLELTLKEGGIKSPLIVEKYYQPIK